MPLKHWKKLEDKILIKNKHWIYKLDKFEIEPGNSGDYHYVHTNGSTLIIPITESNNLLLVNQYRYLVDKESLEFPCGAVEDGLSFEDNAKKELAEETGFSSNNFFKAGEYAPYNGVSDEMCSVYIANNLFKESLPKDTTEEFELIEIDPDDFEGLVDKGIIWDGMTLAGWTIAKKFINRNKKMDLK